MRLAKAGVAAAGIAVAQPAAGRLAPMVGGTTHPRAAAIREASRTRCSCIFKLRARGEVQGRAASEREGVQVECWLFLTTASLPGGKSLRRKSLAPAQRVAQQLRPPPRARKAAAPLGGTRARRVGRQAQRRGDSPRALCASVQGRSLRESSSRELMAEFFPARASAAKLPVRVGAPWPAFSRGEYNMASFVTTWVVARPPRGCQGTKQGDDLQCVIITEIIVFATSRADTVPDPRSTADPRRHRERARAAVCLREPPCSESDASCVDGKNGDGAARRRPPQAPGASGTGSALPPREGAGTTGPHATGPRLCPSFSSPHCPFLALPARPHAARRTPQTSRGLRDSPPTAPFVVAWVARGFPPARMLVTRCGILAC